LFLIAEYSSVVPNPWPVFLASLSIRPNLQTAVTSPVYNLNFIWFLSSEDHLGSKIVVPNLPIYSPFYAVAKSSCHGLHHPRNLFHRGSPWAGAPCGICFCACR